ncbi:hypothetical protein [Priestia aryabhattai]
MKNTSTSTETINTDKNNQVEKLSVLTPVGEITVKENPDPEYPGVWIQVNGQELVLVDYSAEEKTHFVRVWTKKRDDEGDDYIAKIDLESND